MVKMTTITNSTDCNMVSAVDDIPGSVAIDMVTMAAKMTPRIA